MLLKYTAYTLAVIALLAETSEARRRRRKGKRRPQQPAAAPVENDDIFSAEFNGPGSSELIESLVSDSFENMDEFIAEFADEEDDGFRGVGGPPSEQMFRGVTLQQIMNAGGPEFCRDMSKIRPENRPRPGMPGWTQWSEMMGKCAELNGVMSKRRTACINFLMKIVYNPLRDYDLKPFEKTRHKYCYDITKLRNPWLWCEKKCPLGKKGRFCNNKKNQCNQRLDTWIANKEALKDKSNTKCRPLPNGMKTPPPANHPANNKRKCTKVGKQWKCEAIIGADLPWCPFGYTEANKEQAFGKGKGAAWGKGKKKKKGGRRPRGKGKGGFRELSDPSSDKFQQMAAEMNSIESQFGHAALNKEIQKFQNQKKRRNNKGRTSYEEAVALSYVDDDVQDK